MSRVPKLHRDDHRKFFKVTNELYKLRHNPGQLTNGSYRDILVELCSALDNSLEKGLENAIRSFDAEDADIRRQSKKIVSDLTHFAETMIFTRRQLEACGVETDTAEEIILYVAALRTELGRTEFSPEAAATAAK